MYVDTTDPIRSSASAYQLSGFVASFILTFTINLFKETVIFTLSWVRSGIYVKTCSLEFHYVMHLS
jgi:hypothetical protein